MDRISIGIIGGGFTGSLRLGLDVTRALRTIAADGKPARRLFAAGPVTKGRFWEITAVPELRRQCRELAGRIATELHS